MSSGNPYAYPASAVAREMVASEVLSFDDKQSENVKPEERIHFEQILHSTDPGAGGWMRAFDAAKGIAAEENAGMLEGLNSPLRKIPLVDIAKRRVEQITEAAHMLGKAVTISDLEDLSIRAWVAGLIDTNDADAIGDLIGIIKASDFYKLGKFDNDADYERVTGLCRGVLKNISLLTTADQPARETIFRDFQSQLLLQVNDRTSFSISQESIATALKVSGVDWKEIEKKFPALVKYAGPNKQTPW